MLTADLLVIGDELEGLHTAVSAARQGLHVVLARANAHPWLGGLSTRGGLAYMDITPETTGPLFTEFLRRANVCRVCLDPVRANAVLQAWCKEHAISLVSLIISNNSMPIRQTDSGDFQLTDAEGQDWSASILVDATADADIARHLGAAYMTGLSGLLGPGQPDFLGVSPVFRITGVDRWALMSFEATLRADPRLPGWLNQALPWHSPAERAELLSRFCVSPATDDYLDILNPVIGISFHYWRYGDASTYPSVNVWIDGGNIALLPDGSLSFNGMVTYAPDLATLLHWSHQSVIPNHLQQAMNAFERFLREVGGFRAARIIPPDYLYVRQTVHIKTRRMSSALDLLAGGAATGIGTNSYWLDTRGITLRTCWPGFTSFPKPAYQLDIQTAWCAQLDNLAIVGRAAGYSPLAQGACRIVQHNCLLGEAVGIAAATAITDNIPLHAVLPEDVLIILKQRGLQQSVSPQDYRSVLPVSPAMQQALQIDAALVQGVKMVPLTR